MDFCVELIFRQVITIFTNRDQVGVTDFTAVCS